MTKNIVIVAFALVAIASIIYGRVQSQLAEENRKLAEAAQRIAQEQSILAERNAMEAKNQAQLAEQALMNCEKSKRK